MNIKILDSWLREYLQTDAKPQEIAEKLSLTSVSIERIEKYNEDWLYDIEVTTNRPDLMSVVGLAREAAAVLPQFGIEAWFIPPKLEKPQDTSSNIAISIENDPKLINRICAVVMEVTVKQSPEKIKTRLESSDIRSLNNLIDITNYVMRTIGHPAHVFDFDRLNTDKLVIRESKKGERIQTLDHKDFILPGGDIVAVDGNGRIIDLLGIMGLENSVVTDKTKRILFFIDNNDPVRMRKTSMSLAIRSEAAQLNEKGIDPELADKALQFGIKLYEELADGKVMSEIIDMYPNKPRPLTITVSEEKINTVIGVPIPLSKAVEILTSLGFETTQKDKQITVTVPSFRIRDVSQEEDIVEEIARVYGYHNLPSVLPPLISPDPVNLEKDPFYWEERVRQILKYWGYTETYTYSMVSEALYEGPLEEAVTLKNPLDEEHVYMRRTLVPSILQVLKENSSYKQASLFEIANVYEKNGTGLPREKRMLAGVAKKPDLSFYDVKGVVEQLGKDLGITFAFKTAKEVLGADVFIGRERVGTIEELDEEIVDFELDFTLLLTHATRKKIYKPTSKYPPIIEDLALVISDDIATGDIIDEIKKQSSLIAEVSLLDKFQTTRTFHILYQDPEKNLTSGEVSEIRIKILDALKGKFKAKVK